MEEETGILSRPDNERCGGSGWCGKLVVVDAAVVMVEGKRDGDGGGVGWGSCTTGGGGEMVAVARTVVVDERLFKGPKNYDNSRDH